MLGRSVAVALVVGLAALGLFVVLARQVTAETALVELDRQTAERLHEHARDTPALARAFRTITELGSLWFLALFAAVVAVVLGFRRQPALACAWLLVLAGGGLLDWGLKAIFDRPRPVFADPLVWEDTTSFPSGHSMGSIVSYGLLGYLVAVWLVKPAARVAVVAGLAGLVAAIGFSRVYLGAHWFSDVLGGFAAGAVWLSACIALLEALRRKERVVGRRIFHLVAAADWDPADPADFHAASLDREGFIHCSNADQVAWVANEFYSGQAALVALCIDTAALSSRLVDEDPGCGQRFPHVYGAIDRRAIVAAIPLQRDANGQWTFRPPADRE
jgi:membrane-associated phospholipid phosphatase